MKIKNKEYWCPSKPNTKRLFRISPSPRFTSSLETATQSLEEGRFPLPLHRNRCLLRFLSRSRSRLLSVLRRSFGRLLSQSRSSSLLLHRCHFRNRVRLRLIEHNRRQRGFWRRGRRTRRLDFVQRLPCRSLERRFGSSDSGHGGVCGSGSGRFYYWDRSGRGEGGGKGSLIGNGGGAGCAGQCTGLFGSVRCGGGGGI